MVPLEDECLAFWIIVQRVRLTGDLSEEDADMLCLVSDMTTNSTLRRRCGEMMEWRAAA